MAAGGHFGLEMSIIELVLDIWMNNACVKFEERSLNPSKVIALTTKLRRNCGEIAEIAADELVGMAAESQ